MKAGFSTVKAECLKLGMDLSKTPAGIYKITTLGSREPEFCGDYREVWAFQLGASWMKQHLTHNYELLAKRG